jgi:hypothetical protein
MNAAQMAAALENHNRLCKPTEIPLFYGIEEKETQTLKQFINCRNNAAVAAGWAPAQTG